MSQIGQMKDEFCKKRAIDEIGKHYVNLDGKYARIINFPANRSISPDGLSLMDDIEFFLGQSKLNKEMEEELFKVIQVFALKYLRYRRSYAGNTNEKAY
jgi:hypothetical protein